MRSSIIRSAITALTLALSAVNGLNVLVTNDDGFGTSNIREMYKAIKSFGHNVYIVASTSNQSGTGGTAVFTNQANLTADTEFGIVKKGAPSFGTDPSDSHIWYYNGTPSTCVQVGLDYVFPKIAGIPAPDVVMSGPNFGLNLGAFLFTLSGTIGATYTAVERGIPAIAFSAGYSVQTPYFYTNASTKAGLKDPATITGLLAANLLQQIIANSDGSRLLPLGYGLSVNIPYITSYTNSSCVNPPFILTRQTGGADVDSAVLNTTTGLFTYANVVAPGLNTCINGDCSLPGETNILASGCQSSVSVFTVDYDAPSGCKSAPDVGSLLMPLVQYVNSTKLVGGLNGTSAFASNSTGVATGSAQPMMPTATPTTITVNGGAVVRFSWSIRAIAIVGAVVLGL